MLTSVLENSFFAIKMEMKEKELELLKELDLAIKERYATENLDSPTALICQGRQEAYLRVYERIFGILRRNKDKDGSLDISGLQDKIIDVFKELKELLKS